MARGDSSKRRRQGTPPPTGDSPYAPPWPREVGMFVFEEGVFGDDPRREMDKPQFKNRPITDYWDQFDALAYNGIADISFQPSRVFDLELLERLKLRASLVDLMQKLGMGHIAFTRYPLYPDYALQCLASCQVMFPEGADRTAQHGIFTFKVNGRRYSVPFPALCRVYGFDETKTALHLPDTFPGAHEFWRRIAESGWTRNQSALSDIRHPVLRLLVKSFGHTILCALENNKVLARHLALLFYAIGDRWPEYSEAAATFDLNMGSVFAHHLCQLKTLRAYKTGTRFEYVGSFLTPLFRLVGIDLTLPTRCVPLEEIGESLIDETHLRRGLFLKISRTSTTPYRYIWHHREGSRLIPLPSEWTAIDTAEDLEFQLPHGVWMMDSGSRARRPRRAPTSSQTTEDRPTGLPSSRTSGRASASTSHAAPDHSPPRDSSAAFLGDYTHPSDATYRDQEGFNRHVDGVLARIWGAIAGLQRSCRCARAADAIPPRPPRRHDSESGPSGHGSGQQQEEEDDED